MYRLIVLLLPLFLFACSNNPVENNAQQKATGKISIVCTYTPSVTAKIAAHTERATISIWSNKFMDPIYYENVPTDVVTGGATATWVVDMAVGTGYRVDIKGYDSTNEMTYFGSTSNVSVEKDVEKNVTISLVMPVSVTYSYSRYYGDFDGTATANKFPNNSDITETPILFVGRDGGGMGAIWLTDIPYPDRVPIGWTHPYNDGLQCFESVDLIGQVTIFRDGDGNVWGVMTHREGYPQSWDDRYNHPFPEFQSYQMRIWIRPEPY